MNTPAPASAPRTTAAWQDLDRQHYLHPFTDYKALQAKGARVIVRAEGVYLYDGDGNAILDGMAGLWCVNVGYGRENWCARQPSKCKSCRSTTRSSKPRPAGHRARHCWSLRRASSTCLLQFIRLGSQRHRDAHGAPLLGRPGQPNRQIFISRWNAYHGSTMADASLGGMSPCIDRRAADSGVEHVMQPYAFTKAGEDDDEFAARSGAGN